MQEYFIPESSVYRILKAYDLITSPAYIILSADDKFQHPTKRMHKLWQTQEGLKSAGKIRERTLQEDE